ncbi:MAG: bifunctional adenosylcobinamide kinase/adenosylcobinamide-phosphate guanylyltransferase [Solirubrobacteraceae bacterium]|nr:bifunctional adenosylcobinamide kinase/adenosylcobinamide-phosphate guanylyltransferase [Solirubrobacteraceae bacterium]
MSAVDPSGPDHDPSSAPASPTPPDPVDPPVPDTPSRLVLVLGGARSGKSVVAERLALDAGGPVRYLATAPDGPDGDAGRIAEHRARRPVGWETVDATGTTDLAGLLDDAGPSTTVLLDGLGAWIADALHRAGLLDDDGNDPDPADGIDGAATIAAIGDAVALLAEAAASRPGSTIVVGEEAGMAPVAADRGTRRWVDLLGRAHQRLASRAGRALLVVAGRTVELPADPGAPSTAVTRATPVAPIAVDPPPPGDGTVPDAQVVPGDPAEHDGGIVDGTADDDAEPLPDATPTHPALRLHGDRMVPDGMHDLAVNVVAGDPPGWAVQALRTGLDRSDAYPDDRAAVAALASRHGRPADGVLPLGGAVEGFWRTAFALRPRRAAVLVPGFTEAEAALRAVGADVARVRRDPRTDWALDPSTVPEDADMVVLGRPANPTGTLDPREVILRLRRPGRTLVVDEAFIDLVDGGERGVDALADEREADGGQGSLVVLRSLTKVLTVPGIRCGYLLSDPDTVARIRDAGPPWTCSAPALALLEAYAGRPEAMLRTASRVAGHRHDLVARLRQIAGLQVWEGAANYVLVRAPDGIDVTSGLHGHGLAVRPCITFPGLDERYVRIAVRTPAIHAQLTQALVRVLADAER